MKRLIFGCGFLGLPTGKAWADDGDKVFGITRKSAEINPASTSERFGQFSANNIQPITADVVDPDSLKGIPLADTVLIAVGMDRSAYSDIRMVYVDGLKNVLESLPNETGHLIYVSSTGVYGDFGGEWVNEDSPTVPVRDGGKACLEAESLIKQSRFADRFTILRFAGIYGGKRVPMKKTIENRDWGKLNPNGWLNLIHVEDGAQIIKQVSMERPFGKTFLVSDGNPVMRKDYYNAVAEFLKCELIDWPNENEAQGDHGASEQTFRGRGSDKRIDNSQLQKSIKYDFRYPDYRAGLKDAFQPSA